MSGILIFRNDTAELIGAPCGSWNGGHGVQMGEEPNDHVDAWARALQVTNPRQRREQVGVVADPETVAQCYTKRCTALARPGIFEDKECQTHRRKPSLRPPRPQ